MPSLPCAAIWTIAWPDFPNKSTATLARSAGLAIPPMTPISSLNASIGAISASVEAERPR